MKIPVVLIGQDNLSLASLRQQIEKERDFIVSDKIRGFDDAFESLRTKTGPGIAIFDLSREPAKALALAQEVKLKLPQFRLVVTAGNKDPEIILEAMRSGAEEFLSQPFHWPTVLQSMGRIRAKINLQAPKGSQHGEIITVFSNKGGVGTTTIATNLAVALAANHQKSVCIVDLVLQFGSVTSFLNLEAYYTILDLVKNLKQMDHMLLEGSLVQHSSGVRVLSEPFRAEDANSIKAGDVEHILAALEQSFDYVIVDTPKDFDDTVSVALDQSHQILFVSEMDIPSLKSSRRALEFFDRLGGYDSKIRLILNRYIKSKIMTVEAVEKALGIKVCWTLPNDYPTVIGAVNQGISILENDPKSEIAKGYRALADRIADGLWLSQDATQEKEKKGGILGQWIPALGRNLGKVRKEA
jgi:pilus assembly protein CpaE